MPILKVKTPRKTYSIEGTSFQMNVWRALLAIPKGKTMTYAELARRIGKPKAARAVANACGANPLPVIVPCHRVVRSDGTLGGYSGAGGVKRKQALLRQEQAMKKKGAVHYGKSNRD